MEELIRIEKLEKYYKNGSNITKAVNKVSLTINNGEFIGIMGASGSGKTTLLNMIATIDKATAGHIYYGDTDITTLNDDELCEFRQENLGFIFQDLNLLDTLTIEENIILAMSLRNESKELISKKVNEITRKLGIGKICKKFPYEVSGGQKQRCACARALINNPKLILADEPTGALDSKSSQMLLETMETMNQEIDATILMVTHDPFSASYCNKILFLRDGEIFYQLERGDKLKRKFLNEILDVLSLTGGDVTNAEQISLS